MLTPNKRYAVFSLNHDERRKTTIWTRAGNAYVNRDGSMNLYLDVLPLEGRLHVREAGEVKEVTSSDRPSAIDPLQEPLAAEATQ